MSGGVISANQDESAGSTETQKPREMQGFDESGSLVMNYPVPPRGVEQPTNLSTNSLVEQRGGTESGTLCKVDLDSSLTEVVESWPQLTLRARARIVEMIRVNLRT